MKSALKEVERRRRKQALHNKKYNVTPKSATQGSESSERSLFDIMSEEINAEKMSIGTMLSKSSSGNSDNNRDGTVNDEEVERALERWRQRREPNSEAFIRATTMDFEFMMNCMWSRSFSSGVSACASSFTCIALASCCL